MKTNSIMIAAMLSSTSFVYAQTYKDSGGTVTSAFVPLVGCSSGSTCSGPVSSSNPMPVTGSLITSMSSLPAGSNVIGAVTQSSGPWTVNHTQLNSVSLGSPTTWGTAPTGAIVQGVNANILALPSLPTGSNVIGAVTQSSGPWTVNHTQLNSVSLGSPTTWGTAPTGAIVQGVNANILALPSLPSGTSTIGAIINQGSSSITYANSHAVSASLVNSLVIKASSGNLYNVSATAITGGASGYLVIINATTAPTSGSAITPLDFCYFSATVGCSISHNIIPINYSTGIVALITTASSPYTYTSGTDTAAISGDYQ